MQDEDAGQPQGAGVIREDLEALLETLRSVKGGCEDGLSAIDRRERRRGDPHRVMSRTIALNQAGQEKIGWTEKLLRGQVRRQLNGAIRSIEDAERTLAQVLSCVMIRSGRCGGLIELVLRNIREEGKEKACGRT